MRSIYTDTLIELIQKYVEEHPGIDQNRIYIGGCSNGGYMTMNLLFEKPDYFAAAYPVCDAAGTGETLFQWLAEQSN